MVGIQTNRQCSLGNYIVNVPVEQSSSTMKYVFMQHAFILVANLIMLPDHLGGHAINQWLEEDAV